MDVPFLGEMMVWPGQFVPRGWAFAKGQAIPTAANEPLFKLLGHAFGGEGEVFMLPNLPDVAEGRYIIALYGKTLPTGPPKA